MIDNGAANSANLHIHQSRCHIVCSTRLNVKLADITLALPEDLRFIAGK